MTKSRHSKKSKRRDDPILCREVAAIRRLKKRAASHGVLALDGWIRRRH
jgi:hypothetical protein